jgi:biopolymer transport protein ExbB
MGARQLNTRNPDRTTHSTQETTMSRSQPTIAPNALPRLGARARPILCALVALMPSIVLADTATAPTRVVDNPYGLGALWAQGDVVARGTLAILLLMSMGTWYVFITRLLEQAKLRRQADAVGDGFWKAKSLSEGTRQLEASSPFRYIADAGIAASDHHEDALTSQIDLNTWITLSMQRSIQKVQSRLQDGLAVLATVGSTAPFVGLFGTVWGIYHALTAIGIAGQASIDKVAGPVGEALIMTAIGLAVAVPAVLGYNWLVRRNKAAMEQVKGFGDSLHSVLLSQAARKTA